MTPRLTLDSWTSLDEFGSASVCLARHVIELAERNGPEGFTADDVRLALRGSYPRNPGAILGGLVADGRLEVVGEEPSRVRSSKGRKVRRFILAAEET